MNKKRRKKILKRLAAAECGATITAGPGGRRAKESDWNLYLRIYDECCEARRNHNIRQDLLEKDTVQRFAKAIRKSKVESVTAALNKIHDLAGQIDHPHAGAIQAWVHKVLPCAVHELKKEGNGDEDQAPAIDRRSELPLRDPYRG